MSVSYGWVTPPKAKPPFLLSLAKKLWAGPRTSGGAAGRPSSPQLSTTSWPTSGPAIGAKRVRIRSCRNARSALKITLTAVSKPSVRIARRSLPLARQTSAFPSSADVTTFSPSGENSTCQMFVVWPGNETSRSPEATS